MRLFIANMILALVWCAVTGSFTALNFLFGFVLGIFALMLIRRESMASSPTSPRLRCSSAVSTSFSSLRMRSTIRARRPVMTLSRLPIATSRKIGVIANWMISAMVATPDPFMAA